jgi:hypothetical protein
MPKTVMGLVWSNDPESYAGGGLVTVRVPHARHIKRYDQDKKGYPDPPGKWLSEGA